MYSPHMREMRSLHAGVLKAKLHCFLCTQILFCYCSRVKCWLWWCKTELECSDIEESSSRNTILFLTRIFLLDLLHFRINVPPPSQRVSTATSNEFLKFFFYRHKISTNLWLNFVSTTFLWNLNGLCISGIKHCIGAVQCKVPYQYSTCTHAILYKSKFYEHVVILRLLTLKRSR